MWQKSWESSLNQAVTCLSQKKSLPELRVTVVGIGHELRGDDAAGIEVAEGLRPFTNPHFLVINAGAAPENHTSSIRCFAPDLVLLVDAAQLGEPPGTVRWLPWQETSGLSASTHTLPPYLLARFLTAELGCEVALIGIQPADTSLGTGLTQGVETAVRETVAILVSSLSGYTIPQAVGNSTELADFSASTASW